MSDRLLPCPRCRRDNSVRVSRSHGSILLSCWRCSSRWGEPEYRGELERLVEESGADPGPRSAA